MDKDMTRRTFVRTATAFGAVVLVGAATGLAGCGDGGASDAASQAGSQADSASAAGSDATVTADTQQEESAVPADPMSAVVYYSRAGENYNVGVVEVGNTAKIAQEVAAQTGAVLVEVQPASAYPEGYDECCDVALAEQDEGARPPLAQVPDLSAYSTIYLGYPVWWGDLPMFMYTLLEAVDLSGKRVLPFNTHEGSGNAGTWDTIAGLCPDAQVGEGLSLRGTIAQTEPGTVSDAVSAWLAG